jgi:hypothetical protein
MLPLKSVSKLIKRLAENCGKLMVNDWNCNRKLWRTR